MPAYCKACGREAPGISHVTLHQSGWTIGWPWSNAGWMCPVCRGADVLEHSMQEKGQAMTSGPEFSQYAAENGSGPEEPEASAPGIHPNRYGPPCRVCKKTDDVISYPDDHSLAICPGCCDKVEEHPDGEKGHQWEYDKWDGHYCRYCGIPRNCTSYVEDYSS